MWTYKRGEESVLLETMFDQGNEEFVLRWLYSDGREDLERYTNRFTFRARLLELEDDLRSWGWTQFNPSVSLREGWRVR